MKTIIISLFMAITAIAAHAQQKSFYDFTVKTIDGEDLSLSTFKGKKVLVVNVASKCGFTPQYAKLEELYKKYGKDNFVIIGFPANNFLSQEPGSNEEIKEFCTLNYGVTFPMMAKISVKGKVRHTLNLLCFSFSESGEKVIYPTNQINYNHSSYYHCNDTT
jgi:glutathione peroxidase